MSGESGSRPAAMAVILFLGIGLVAVRCVRRCGGVPPLFLRRPPSSCCSIPAASCLRNNLYYNAPPADVNPYSNVRQPVATQHGRGQHPTARHKHRGGHPGATATVATTQTATAVTPAIPPATTTTTTAVPPTVFRAERFAFSTADGVVYGRALRRHSSAETTFTEMELTMQVLIPITDQADEDPRSSSSAPPPLTPPPHPRRPAVLMVHGGCFAMGNNGWLAERARWYAARGFNVFSINYRHMASSCHSKGDDVRQRNTCAMFWTSSHAFTRSALPHTHRAMCSSACPMRVGC